jgi:hypothetical protein
MSQKVMPDPTTPAHSSFVLPTHAVKAWQIGFMLHKRIAEPGALINRLNVAMRPDETQMEASGILRRKETIE